MFQKRLNATVLFATLLIGSAMATADEPLIAVSRSYSVQAQDNAFSGLTQI